eukprot:scaffold42145_cov221-Amphora_coffeaeformis.AAC.8
MTIDVKISADFEGGNIEHVETVENDSVPMPVVRLKVRPDLYTELEKINHMQYFCFKAVANENVKIRYVIANAGEVSYPEAWPDTTVCFTTTEDYQNVDEAWRRNLTTRYVGEELVWEHTHTKENPTVYFSYFPPYTYERHCAFMQECEAVQGAKVSVLGKTNDQHDLHYICVGDGPLQAWIIHRQHPGETMAEHFAEGLLRRLLKSNPSDDKDTTVVDKVLSEYTLHIVPCMCPDGAVRGHLRTNGVGANLNREWATVHENYEAPTMKRSPEVYFVLQKMKETGVDFFLDVHGDEGTWRNVDWGGSLSYTFRSSNLVCLCFAKNTKNCPITSSAVQNTCQPGDPVFRLCMERWWRVIIARIIIFRRTLVIPPVRVRKKPPST